MVRLYPGSVSCSAINTKGAMQLVLRHVALPLYVNGAASELETSTAVEFGCVQRSTHYQISSTINKSLNFY